MKKRFLILIVMAFVMTFSYAQDYNTGIGVRGGFAQGITIKHFIAEKTAVEGLISTRWGGIDLTALYEIHSTNVFDVNRLNLYYGIGGHIGYWDGTNVPDSPAGQYVAIGVDAILGLEYNFEEIPINVSVDWKPSFNIIGYKYFSPDGGALSLRYIF